MRNEIIEEKIITVHKAVPKLSSRRPKSPRNAWSETVEPQPEGEASGINHQSQTEQKLPPKPTTKISNEITTEFDWHSADTDAGANLQICIGKNPDGKPRLTIRIKHILVGDPKPTIINSLKEIYHNLQIRRTSPRSCINLDGSGGFIAAIKMFHQDGCLEEIYKPNQDIIDEFVAETLTYDEREELKPIFDSIIENGIYHAPKKVNHNISIDRPHDPVLPGTVTSSSSEPQAKEKASIATKHQASIKKLSPKEEVNIDAIHQASIKRLSPKDEASVDNKHQAATESSSTIERVLQDIPLEGEEDKSFSHPKLNLLHALPRSLIRVKHSASAPEIHQELSFICTNGEEANLFAKNIEIVVGKKIANVMHGNDGTFIITISHGHEKEILERLNSGKEGNVFMYYFMTRLNDPEYMTRGSSWFGEEHSKSAKLAAALLLLSKPHNSVITNAKVVSNDVVVQEALTQGRLGILFKKHYQKKPAQGASSVSPVRRTSYCSV